jgi:hypothetical protein
MYPESDPSGDAIKSRTKGDKSDDLVDAERLPHQAKLLGYTGSGLRHWIWLKSGQVTPSLYDAISCLHFAVQRHMNGVL